MCYRNVNSRYLFCRGEIFLSMLLRLHAASLLCCDVLMPMLLCAVFWWASAHTGAWHSSLLCGTHVMSTSCCCYKYKPCIVVLMRFFEIFPNGILPECSLVTYWPRSVLRVSLWNFILYWRFIVVDEWVLFENVGWLVCVVLEIKPRALETLSKSQPLNYDPSLSCLVFSFFLFFFFETRVSL